MLPHAYDSAAAGEATGQIRRILVVDDSQMQRRILCAMLRQWGFEVWQADSGEAALRLCADLLPDAVLSDWMMPGMDGLDFCRRFRALQRDSYGYFILLTSKSDKGEIARGLDAGADDFLTKPVDAGELRARINAGARILAMQRQLSDTLGELRAAYDAVDRDLRQARTIQQALVPQRSRVFGTSRVSLLLKPCGHVGGDLVGMFSHCDRKLGLYSLDVSVPERPKARTAREDAARLIRGRLADPRWIAAQLRHGYRGAQELAQGLDAVFVLAAASDAVTDAGFEALYAAWVADAEVFEHLRAANPAAARAILERFDEARDRGLWHSRRNALPADALMREAAE